MSRIIESRALPLLAAACASLVPGLARPQEATPEPEVVAEALYLHDCLPPGGRDVALSLALGRGEPDPATGARSLEATPRLQAAVALGERLGLVAEVGIGGEGRILDAPGASLKVLLREPGPARTGLSFSLDLLGSSHSLREAETGVGLGAIQPLGAVSLRAAVTAATSVSSWAPHLHAGLSAAVALSARWRALGEVVAEVGGGEATVSAGPILKLALGERASLMAGALFPVAPARLEPLVTVQLAHSI